MLILLNDSKIQYVNREWWKKRMYPTRIRLLMAKTGSDIHDRGAKVVSMALRDAGVEVIYAGLYRTPTEIIEAAIQEDANCIGLSILDGTHMTIIPEIMQIAKQNGINERLFIVGGAITSNEEVQTLKDLGVVQVFMQGTPPKKVVDFVLGFFMNKTHPPKKKEQPD